MAAVRVGPAWSLGLVAVCLWACGPAAPAPDAGQDGPLCRDACAAGQARCGPDGARQECTGPDERGCLVWGPPTPCPGLKVCVDGACACEADCEAGATCCEQTVGTRTCQGPDPDGCLLWGEIEPCQAGWKCIQDACVRVSPPACPDGNECAFVGQKVCVTRTQYRECRQAADGCLVFDCSS
jgi:hypothetical protein